jgi:MFS family permease
MSVAAAVGSGLVNGSTRIFMGLMIDRFKFKSLFAIIVSVQVFNGLVCFWAAKWAPAFFVCVLLNYFVIAAIFTILPVSVINVFGNKHGPYIYVFVMLGGLFADFINLPLIILVLPKTSFLIIYNIGAVIATICLVILCFFKEELDVENLRKHNGLSEVHESVRADKV